VFEVLGDIVANWLSVCLVMQLYDLETLRHVFYGILSNYWWRASSPWFPEIAWHLQFALVMK